ncbi:MAG: hypothetical protein BWY74_01689 [Firmicutes bacterium ADurb.Bin419]|nr:MAG: hypothetical protein BWY74_01689 [Firmicutes bacterium ADurb.Bin419]
MDMKKLNQAREEECRKAVEDILEKNNCNINVKMLVRVGNMIIDAMPSLVKEGFMLHFVFEANNEEEQFNVIESNDDN